MAGHKITSYIIAQIILIFHMFLEFHRKLRKKKDIDMIMYSKMPPVRAASFLIRRYTVTEDFIMSDSIFFCAYAVTGITLHGIYLSILDLLNGRTLLSATSLRLDIAIIEFFNKTFHCDCTFLSIIV